MKIKILKSSTSNDLESQINTFMTNEYILVYSIHCTINKDEFYAFITYHTSVE